MSEFRIADIRSVTYPLGLTQKDVASQHFLERALRHRKAVEYFVADEPSKEKRITKLEIVFADDPFSRQSIEQFETLRRTIPKLLPDSLAEAEWHLLGGPASIRDLKAVTDRDRLLIQSLTLLGIFLCLAYLLREIALPLELVGLAGLNFLASLGMAYSVFWLLDPEGFVGLDWQVPTVLFVVLVSLSAQNYWMLVARIREEQSQLGRTEGLLSALERTGSLFVASGLIASGLFASFLAGTLVGLKQFGFGLAAGMMFDALVIRPLLIPACLWLRSKDAAQESLPSRPAGQVLMTKR